MDYKVVGVCVFSIIVLLISVFAIKGFGKLIAKCVVNFGIGIAVLFIIHLIGQYYGYKVPFNFVNATIIGFLGIPGIGLMFALQHIL